MLSTWFPALIGLGLVASSLPAAAASLGDCTGVGDLKDHPSIAAARVVGAPRTPFVKGQSSDAACPAATDRCQEKAFMVPGDVVIAGPAAGGFACVEYLSSKGRDRAGWVSEASLRRDAAVNFGLEAWVGTWTQIEAKIVVTRNGTALSLTGEATYGSLDPDRVKRGDVNVGQFEAIAAPTRNEVAFDVGTDKTLPVDKGDEDDCKVWLRRLGPTLVVDDNNQCGGMNVSFRGIYVRKP